MLTEEQLLQRRRGLGGSDIAAIAGLSSYRTAVDVYLDKLGLSEPREMTKNQKHGHIMEPIILDLYEEFTGYSIARSPEMKFSREYPWMFGNLDGICNKIIVDAKYMSTFVNPLWGEPGTDKMPDDVLLQMIHYAIVYDAEKVDVAVFFDRPELFIYTYHRNPDLERDVIEMERKFWHGNVLAEVPPDAKTIDDARALWKDARNGSSKIATNEIVGIFENLRDIKRQIKNLTQQKQHFETQMMLEMQDYESLISPTGFIMATWKNQTSKRLEQSSFRKEYPLLFEKYTNEVDSRVFRLNMMEF